MDVAAFRPPSESRRMRVLSCAARRAVRRGFATLALPNSMRVMWQFVAERAVSTDATNPIGTSRVSRCATCALPMPAFRREDA